LHGNSELEAMTARGLLFLAIGMLAYQFARSIDERRKVAGREVRALLVRVKERA
jgi:hypothetical protein